MGALDFLNPDYLGDSLIQKGWERKKAMVAAHYYGLALEQCGAVIPISILLILVMGVFFQQGVDSPLMLLFGLSMAIIGLTVFIDALRVVVMPLGEFLGSELPKSLSQSWVLVITGILGVLVTYAEPAITSLRPLARLVDIDKAPYLYCALLEKQETLVLMIGLGVGVAAMVGTLRFVHGWSIKPLIHGCMAPCLVLAGYMWFGDPDLRPILGLAWDCGAVTTGPVTVPVLLALGIGVMKTQNEKKEMAEEAERIAKGLPKVEKPPKENALEGFGIVTLASLFPVMFVMMFGITLKFMYTKEDIHAMKPPPFDDSSILERSPFKEAYFASRAILPLCFALFVIVIFVVKQPLPELSYYVDDKDEEETAAPRETELSQFENSGAGGERVPRKTQTQAKPKKPEANKAQERPKKPEDFEVEEQQKNKERAKAFNVPVSDAADFQQRMKGGPESSSEKMHISDSAAINAAFSGELHPKPSPYIARLTTQQPMEPLVQALEKDRRPSIPDAINDLDLDDIDLSDEPPAKGHRVAGNKFGNEEKERKDKASKASALKKNRVSFEMDRRDGDAPDTQIPFDQLCARKSKPERKSCASAAEAWAETSSSAKTVLACGVLQALFGMIMFNLGLNFGFNSLGDQMGVMLPAGFMKTNQEPNSPIYGYVPGVAIALGTMFGLGILATRAEPALNVLGQTVEKLTNGSFTQSMLVWAVAMGVGFGMTIGCSKILFGAHIIVYIFVGYAIAIGITHFINEDMVNIAWDSAGVTTGPVTVPFVLAIGVGCSKAVEAAEGFGILTVASVCPIISVLCVSGYSQYKRSQAAAASDAHSRMA